MSAEAYRAKIFACRWSKPASPSPKVLGRHQCERHWRTRRVRVFALTTSAPAQLPLSTRFKMKYKSMPTPTADSPYNGHPTASLNLAAGARGKRRVMLTAHSVFEVDQDRRYGMDKLLRYEMIAARSSGLGTRNPISLSGRTDSVSVNHLSNLASSHVKFAF